MEACGSAHYWARENAKVGHSVKLMPPKYVKAYVKRGKTDAGDAAAICEAVTREHVVRAGEGGRAARPVYAAQCALAANQSADTQLINAVRGHPSELGTSPARGLLGLAELATIVRDESDQRLPVMARSALMVLIRQA